MSLPRSPRRHEENLYGMKSVLRLIVLILAMGSRAGLAASEHYGQVTFGGLPVPGATVTGSQGDKQVVTITDQQGVYKLADLADGVWTIRVDMLGFLAASQDVTVAAGSQPSIWELKLMPFDEIARLAPPQPATSSFQRAAATANPSNASNSSNPSNRSNPSNPSNPSYVSGLFFRYRHPRGGTISRSD